MLFELRGRELCRVSFCFVLVQTTSASSVDENDVVSSPLLCTAFFKSRTVTFR